jgi:hypothetical protein
MLLIGIDEAGYGPTLGPLCHGLCVLRLPDAPGAAAPDLWARLAPVASRWPAPPGTIAVDDSKKVYAGHGDLQRLRHSVECFLACAGDRSGGTPSPAEPLTRLVPPEDLAAVERDPWGRASESADTGTDSAPESAEKLKLALAAEEVAVVRYGARALSARDFNAWLARLGNKADVAWERVAELLREAVALGRPGEPILAVVDHQGGRKFYGPRLQALFPEAMVWTESESAERSAYRWEGGGAMARVEFAERAESLSFPVALASLAAKLTREFLMARFNAFFRAHDGLLEPTAGYPADARRFLKATVVLRRRLRIADEALIRKR